MTMSSDLDDEICRAQLDSRLEPALLQKLLGVTLYVHSPFGSRSPRLNICMFDRPDGIRVIPVFTDKAKARAASRGKVACVAVAGRELFDATRGATLMINPNDISCTLYPEEINALLESGVIGHCQSLTVNDDEEVRISAPSEQTTRLGDRIARTLSGMHLAERAYLADANWVSRTPSLAWMLIVVAPRLHAERISRAIAAELQSGPPLTRALDVYCLAEEDEHPAWLAEHALKPIYDRQETRVVQSTETGRA
jgi:hypothetical protein